MQQIYGNRFCGWVQLWGKAVSSEEGAASLLDKHRIQGIRITKKKKEIPSYVVGNCARKAGRGWFEIDLNSLQCCVSEEELI